MTSSDRFNLTNESVRARCEAPVEGELNARGRPVTERFYWDSDFRGFGVIARAAASLSWCRRTSAAARCASPSDAYRSGPPTVPGRKLAS